MNQYSVGGGLQGWWNRIPPVVKNIIIINALVYLLSFWCGQQMTNYLFAKYALYPVDSRYFRIYQLVTHIFMHGSFWHLLFNMYAFYFFGCVLENVWGKKKFILYYMVTGIGAALCHLAVMHFMGEYRPIPTVGASGAVYGILLGYGMLFPTNRITMIFPIPMTLKAKWLVVIFGVIELLSGFFLNDSTAHWAHLGGMLFGMLLILHWRRQKRDYTEF